MLMLTLETFLLMLLAGLVGLAAGHLVACGGGGKVDWSSDRPWLREGAVVPAAPTLPAAPRLLDAEERRRLTEASAAPAVAAPEPVAVPAVSAPPTPLVEEAAPAPTAGEDVGEPEPVVEAESVGEAAPAVVEAGPEPAVEAAAPVYVLPAEIAAAAVTPPVADEDAARAAEADAVGTRPLALAAPLGGRADDLKRIRGIGPQNERRLNSLGIHHFSQIAAWTAENARWAGSFLAFQGRIEREDWIGQAKVLATGADTDFSRRVDAGEVPTSRTEPQG